MRYAIIDNGVVTNVVVADSAFGDNWVAIEGGGVGWLYDGSTFTPPPTPIPTKEEQEANRRAAYTVESDPIFFMSQRGEATVEEWQAKVTEIKTRFPYPTE
jgi:hypothetical protein